MTHTVSVPAVGDQESLAQYAERMALRFSVPAAIFVALLVVLLNLERNPIPMLEDIRSFGVIGFLAVIPIALLAAGWAFVLGVQTWNERVEADRHRPWKLQVMPVAVAYMLFAAVLGMLLLTFVETGFQYLHLITLQAAGLAGVTVGALTYWIVNDVIRISTGRLLVLIVVIIAGGIYLTITNIDDPLWWQVSFSYLGKMESNVNYIFNFTLVFAGVLVLAWMAFFMSDYRILAQHGVAAERWVPWVRLALGWLAIAVMLVGIFKSNYTPFSSLMHNLSAYSLAVVFGLLMMSVRWTVPGFPAEFRAMSWILVALLVATLISAALGRMNTVGLEIVAFALGMTWLSNFVGNTEEMARELRPEAFPE